MAARGMTVRPGLGGISTQHLHEHAGFEPTRRDWGSRSRNLADRDSESIALSMYSTLAGIAVGSENGKMTLKVLADLDLLGVELADIAPDPEMVERRDRHQECPRSCSNSP